MLQVEISKFHALTYHLSLEMTRSVVIRLFICLAVTWNLIEVVFILALNDFLAFFPFSS